MESGLSAPHEWQATGGVEVKGKGTMDTFLFLPDAAVAVPPSNGATAALLRQQQQLGMQQQQHLSTCGPQSSELMFRLMEASSSVKSPHTAWGPPPGSDYGATADDGGASSSGVGGPLQRSLSGMGPAGRRDGASSQLAVFDLFRGLEGHGNAASGSSGERTNKPSAPLNMMLESLHEDRPSAPSEESPFLVVGEVLSALRAAQQQQQNSVSGRRSASAGQPTSRSPLSAGERSSTPDRKSPLGKTTASSSHATGAAEGGRGSGGRGSGGSRAAPSAWRPLDALDAATGAAGAAAASSSRYNVVHCSSGGGSGSLSAALMEALGSTTAASRRRPATAAATATATAGEAATVRRRGSNTGALTCFPTSLS